ncbi:uncharacterized protein BJX67DRAFT_252880 [Aspergillus lucknowensis]|uniref:GPI transamidase component PIG-S n=1 Tax=Aspergillus lucknowensis TaxID=176173 RepID=A0ABR4LHG2_9EURO
MANPHTTHVSLRRSILMLLSILTANASPNLHLQRADSCPSSSQQCTGDGLPDNFCCSSSSSCVTIDSGSSVICCPDGQNCTYIEPITCDVTKQDPSLFPDNVIKTTRLDDNLPTCGNLCCPFGYTCQGEFCAMDDAPSPTSTKGKTTSTATSTSTSETTKTKSPVPSTATADEATSDATTPTAGTISTVTTESSATAITVPTPTLSQYSATSDDNLNAAEAKCPTFPTNAVLAGFFPGSVFGAVAALLLTVCFRRHQKNNIPAGEKVSQSTYRKSTGTLIGISDPIPSDESSFRTDFLRTNPKRNSEGARSVLQRSRSRVKSLFSGGLKPNSAPAEDVPPVPTMPMTPPRQRQPSTESIRVYTPPGVFANASARNPAPYSDRRPDTTLTEILDQAQAQIRAQSAASSRNNSSTNSTATTANQRFLQPPPQGSARRKPLPY